MKTLFGKEVISRAEAALKIGVSLPTVIVWTKTGILKSFKIGTRTYVPVTALTEMEESLMKQ